MADQIGTSGNDILTGTAQGDNISGGLGNDTLTGGGGADGFYFNNITNTVPFGTNMVVYSKDGVDMITDFSQAEDTIIDVFVKHLNNTAHTSIGSVVHYRPIKGVNNISDTRISSFIRTNYERDTTIYNDNSMLNYSDLFIKKPNFSPALDFSGRDVIDFRSTVLSDFSTMDVNTSGF